MSLYAQLLWSQQCRQRGGCAGGCCTKATQRKACFKGHCGGGETAETCGRGQYNLRGGILAVVKIHSSRHVCFMLIGIVVVPLYFTPHSIVFWKWEIYPRMSLPRISAVSSIVPSRPISSPQPFPVVVLQLSTGSFLGVDWCYENGPLGRGPLSLTDGNRRRPTVWHWPRDSCHQSTPTTTFNNLDRGCRANTGWNRTDGTQCQTVTSAAPRQETWT